MNRNERNTGPKHPFAEVTSTDTEGHGLSILPLIDEKNSEFFSSMLPLLSARKCLVAP